MNIKLMLLGVVVLLLLKYVIFGLDDWDAVLHPGRVEPASLDNFKRPLLGMLE